MSQVRKTSREIGKEILKAIRQDKGPSSLVDILRYLSSKKLLNKTDSKTTVQLNLNNAVVKGLLKKLNDGKYKINETARRRKPRSGSQELQVVTVKPKRRSRSRKRSGSRRRRRSSSGKRGKRSSSRRKRKRSSSGRRRKRSTSRRRRSRRRTKAAEELE